MVTDLCWVCGEAFSREVHKNLHFCIFDLRSKIDATRECQSKLCIPLAAPIFAVIAVIAFAISMFEGLLWVEKESG